MEEPSSLCSASLEDYCEELCGFNTSSRFAMLLTLPLRFQGQQLDADQADAILNSMPDELWEELLSSNDEELCKFQDLAIEILETLLPSCSKHTLYGFSSLLPNLVHRLKMAKNDIIALNSISKCALCLCFDSDLASTKFIHETADVLTSYCVRNFQDFPFLVILERLIDCMLMLQHHDENYDDVSRSYHWPKNMQTITSAFLKTRTELLTDEMRKVSFRLTKEVLEVLGVDWLSSEVDLLILLVHLVVVQTRMCLDKPESTDTEVLAVCFYILEITVSLLTQQRLHTFNYEALDHPPYSLDLSPLTFIFQALSEIKTMQKLSSSAIRCAEESSFLDDSAATQVANSVREAGLYSIQFWVDAKDQNERLSEEVEILVYRFTCCLLAIGGAKMLPESLLRKCSEHMVRIFERSIVEKDFTTARLLLPNLVDLPQLQDSTIVSLVDLVIAQYPAGEWRQTLEEALLTLESLDSRIDYFSKKTVNIACFKLKSVMPSCKLLEVISTL